MSKKRFTSFLFLIICTLFYAKGINIAISPYYQITKGQIEEFIYSSRTEKKVSYLEWELNPLQSFGMQATFNFNYAELLLDGSISIPTKTGKMYDSDYNQSSGLKHTYSIHDENAIFNTNVLISLAGIIPLNQKIKISPVAQVQYTYDSFEARNGYGWYGSSDWSETKEEVSWDDPAAHYFPDGRYKLGGIDYKRHELYTFIGPKFIINPDERVTLTASFLFSPFTYSSSFDTHLNKKGGTHYQEISWIYGKRYKFEFSSSIRLHKNISTTLLLNLITGPVQKGELYAEIFEEDDHLYLLSQKSGSRTKRATARISIDFLF